MEEYSNLSDSEMKEKLASEYQIWLEKTKEGIK